MACQYNLHLLFYHLAGYKSDIKKTAPDLQVLLGLTDVYEEFDRLLWLKLMKQSLYFMTHHSIRVIFMYQHYHLDISFLKMLLTFFRYYDTRTEI